MENLLERAVALGDGYRITADDLALPQANNNLQTNSGLASSFSDCQPLPNESVDDFLKRIESAIIIKALEECDNNKTRAAEYLGISFRSFRYKLKKLSID